MKFSSRQFLKKLPLPPLSYHYNVPAAIDSNKKIRQETFDAIISSLIDNYGMTEAEAVAKTKARYPFLSDCGV